MLQNTDPMTNSDFTISLPVTQSPWMVLLLSRKFIFKVTETLFVLLNAFNFKKVHKQLWLVWFSGLSASLRPKCSRVWFPVRAHAWVGDQVPSGGDTRSNHTFMFLSLSLSFPLSLNINKLKKIFKNRKKAIL